MKFSVKKICSKEKFFRLFLGLVILFAVAVLPTFDEIGSFVFVFVGIYLLVTGLIGSCMLYSIWKE